MKLGDAKSARRAAPPPPRWLVRLALASGGAAALTLALALWLKWGLVMAMGQDILKACF